MEKPYIGNLSEADRGLEEARIRAAYARRQGDTRYSWFSRGHVFVMQQREREVLTLLERFNFNPLAEKTILEIGCGNGYWLLELIKWGALPENITGVELLSDRVAEAKRRCPTSLRVHCSNATRLAFADASFDLVLQSTVFSSILDFRMKQQIAREMLRVVREDGLIIWYDYHINNPWNPDILGIKKQEIHHLFPNSSIQLKRITLAPPLARMIAQYSWLICYFLSKVPLLCTAYLGVIQKHLRTHANATF